MIRFIVDPKYKYSCVGCYYGNIYTSVGCKDPNRYTGYGLSCTNRTRHTTEYGIYVIVGLNKNIKVL